MYDEVNHPKHYDNPFEATDIQCSKITFNMGFPNGCAFKYVWRAGEKGDRSAFYKDLEKAQWYLREIMWVNFKEEPIRLYAARGVFGLIKAPDHTGGTGLTLARRYRILRLILNEEYDSAISLLSLVINEEKSKDANSAAESGDISADVAAQEN